MEQDDKVEFVNDEIRVNGEVWFVVRADNTTERHYRGRLLEYLLRDMAEGRIS